MAKQPIDRLRVAATVVITVAIWGLLAWQHNNAGVPAHHLLHNPDLPRVSNWFGGVLLPVLAWFLLGLTRRRMKAADSASLNPVLVGLVAGLAFGVAMSITFFNGHESVTSYLFFGLLPLALFVPVHRPECLLGFVLGMSMAFGAVLPTLFGTLMAVATSVIHRLIGLPLQQLVGLRADTSSQGLQ